MDVIDQLSKWSQGPGLGPCNDILRVIEQLLHAPAAYQAVPASKFSDLHSFTVYYVLDPRRSMAYNVGAKRLSFRCGL